MRKTRERKAFYSLVLSALYAIAVVFSSVGHSHDHADQVGDEQNFTLSKKSLELSGHSFSDCQACHFLNHQFDGQNWVPFVALEPAPKDSALIFTPVEKAKPITYLFAQLRGPPTELI